MIGMTYEKGLTWRQVVGYQVVRYVTPQNHLKSSDTNNNKRWYFKISEVLGKLAELIVYT